MTHHLHIYAERELIGKYTVRALCGQQANRGVAHSIFDEWSWQGRSNICEACRAELVDIRLNPPGRRQP